MSFASVRHRLHSMVIACMACAALMWHCQLTATDEVHRLSESEAIAQLQQELQKRAADDSFSGAVLVAKDGKPIFQAAYGLADREKKVANTVDTQFRFGSMGKMFTAVAVLQLVQAGKIKLDEPIGKYLTDYPNKDVATKVTVHQLLTHTGGTGDIFGPEFDGAELKELKDYVAVAGDRPPLFEPGSRHQYSNYGFVLLGRIIEIVSGQSYYDYITQHVFLPAGMTSTGNEPEDSHVPGLSIGYTRMSRPKLLAPPGPGSGGPPQLLPPPGENQGGGQPHLLPPPEQGNVPLGPSRPNTAELPYRGTSAGGGYSTVGDFLKFATALTSHQLLDAHHTELLTTGKVRSPRGMYAYGFEDEKLPDGVRRIGHGGGFPGMNGSLSIFPESHYVVVVLANVDPPAATDIDQFIRTRLPLK
jgi:CubicO group peptidase (beta-lactamase class C family)